MTAPFARVCVLTLGLLLGCVIGSTAATMRPTASGVDKGTPTSPPTEHVILFVLEGFGQESVKGGAMPTLSKLIKDGSVTWSATGVKPPLSPCTSGSTPTFVGSNKLWPRSSATSAGRSGIARSGAPRRSCSAQCRASDP